MGKFKPGQAVWYFDYLSSVAATGQGPHERTFRCYRSSGQRAVISSPLGYNVEIQASNVYESREAALEGEENKRAADALLDQFDYDEILDFTGRA